MKTCTGCRLTKPLEDFNLRPTGKYGRCPKCIECVRAYTRTKVGLAHCMYAAQKHNTKNRGYVPVAYTLEEFKCWLFAQPTFNSLHESWIISGYDSEKRPSTDRLNDYSGYTLEGIRLTTWEINKKNGYDDRRNGINTKDCVAVDQLDLEGNFLERYPSISMAARAINRLKGTGTISSVCYGKTLTAYKYKWRFSEIPNNNEQTTLCQN